jgi:hypothetical protein
MLARWPAWAIVSDSWPGDEWLYEQLGIASYLRFRSVCRRQLSETGRTTSDALGLIAGECRCVDDEPELVITAHDLGSTEVS